MGEYIDIGIQTPIFAYILIISSVSYGLVMLLISINFNKIKIKYADEVQIEEKESDEIV